MKPKILGAIQLIGALLAGWFGYQDGSYGVLILALVMLIVAIHHFTEEQ